jgi:hypothetical protein
MEAAHVVLLTGHWIAVRRWWFGDTFRGVPVRIKNPAAVAKAGCGSSTRLQLLDADAWSSQPDPRFENLLLELKNKAARRG